MEIRLTEELSRRETGLLSLLGAWHPGLTRWRALRSALLEAQFPHRNEAVIGFHFIHDRVVCSFRWSSGQSGLAIRP